MKRAFVAGVVALGICLVAAETFAGPAVRVVIGPVHRWPIVVAPIPPIIVVPGPAPRENYGFIDLSVRPWDADVFIDDVFKGPASKYVGKLIQVGIGSHTVAIRREGFRPEQVSIQIAPGRTVELVAELNRIDNTPPKVAVVGNADPAPAPADTPTPASEPEATPASEATPAAPAAEPEGTTTYQMEMSGTGYLALIVVPKDASVYVDDQFYGTAAQFNDTDQAIVLRAGPHKVEIARPGFAPYTGTIEVSTDKQTNVEVTLKKQEAGDEK